MRSLLTYILINIQRLSLNWVVRDSQCYGLPLSYNVSVVSNSRNVIIIGTVSITIITTTNSISTPILVVKDMRVSARMRRVKTVIERGEHDNLIVLNI